METLNSKQKLRKEKKKRKLAALANIVMLNDRDREEAIMADIKNEDLSQNGAVQGPVSEEDDGFIKVTKKNKKSKNRSESCSEQPLSKRLKIDSEAEKDATVNLTDEQYKEMQKQLDKRKRELKKKPDIRLREYGERAVISLKESDRTPIFLTDLQHLVMLALLGKNSPCTPDRWCYFENHHQLSHTVVVCLEGLSLFHYLSNESKFDKINKIFEHKLEVILPKRKEDNETMAMIEEFIQVPITNAQARELIVKHGSLEAAVELNKDPTLIIKGIFPVNDTPVEPSSNDLHPNDKFPRTKLLLSALQMVDEGYPMPLRGKLDKHFTNYAMTKDKYEPVTNRSPLFGIDCEMCQTLAGMNELTRVSIVNEDFETVYETLVMPDNKITNYLTKFSGITEELMRTVTKKLKDVQKDIRQLLPPDAILIGQSLNSDLNALRMMHPYVIDTSICFNITGNRRHKSKLRNLASTFLKEDIQQHEGGHDSVEDSISCVKLVKLKLANSLEFGDELLMQKKRVHDLIRIASGDTIKHNLLAHASKRDKQTAIITAKPLPSTIQELLKKVNSVVQNNPQERFVLHELSSNKESVSKCREIALENALTLCSLHLTTEELQASSFEATIESVNKWISKIWKAMAHNSLLLVLMGGATECSSGLANIAIKRNSADVASNAPLSV